MGACFQAPCAAHAQRQMEMLSWVDFDGLYIAPHNINNNNNNNNNNNLNRKIGISFRPQNYMGASFQAPRAAPRQRQMEMHQDH